jgi:hypothetical protein
MEVTTSGEAQKRTRGQQHSGVAQWKSSSLIRRRSWVRLPPSGLSKIVREGGRYLREPHKLQKLWFNPGVPPPSHELRDVSQFVDNGALAHLVERFHGMEEVAGSTPACSTTVIREPFAFGRSELST